MSDDLLPILLVLTLVLVFVLLMGIRLVMLLMRREGRPLPRERSVQELLVETLRERSYGEQEALRSQRESTMALEALNLLHRTIMDHIPVAVAVLDFNGRVQYANGLFLDTLSVDSIKGQSLGTISDTLNGQWLEMRSLGEQSKSGVPLYIDGMPKIVHLTLTELPDLQFLFTMQDRTRFHALEEQVRLKRELALMGEMASGITHEVKNSLAVVQGRLQMMKYGNVEQHTEKIQLEVDHLLKFVTAFRKSSEGESVRKEVIPLREWFAELVDHWQGHEWGERVSFPADSELAGEVRGDRLLLTTVINNLILNGLEAVAGAEDGDRAPSAWVRIWVAEDPHEMRIGVEDRGPGFAKNVTGKVFVPFVTSKKTGTGLGLFHSRKIMLEHGGSLEVREGLPTTLICHLPKNMD